MSRRRDTYTSMTRLCRSTAREDVGPDLTDLDVGLVDEPAIPARCRTGRAASISKGEPLLTPIEGDLIDLDATPRREARRDRGRTTRTAGTQLTANKIT